MKQSLQLKLSQRLTLTPQLQQSIRLLQLSTQELGLEISQMLQDNPLLERTDGEDRFENLPDDFQSAPSEPDERENRDVYEEMAWGDRAVGGSHGGGDEDDEHDYQQADAAQTGLRPHLLNQLSLTPLSQRDQQLIRLLIEALDDDGYRRDRRGPARGP